MSAPSIYAAINAVTAELARSGIAKSRTNEVDDYKYRSIDDVLDRLAPLLAKHKLCVLPRALERTVIERSDELDREDEPFQIGFELVLQGGVEHGAVSSS